MGAAHEKPRCSVAGSFTFASPPSERDALRNPMAIFLQKSLLSPKISTRCYFVTRSRCARRAGSLAHGRKTPLTILAGEARRLDDKGTNDSAGILREKIAII